MYKLSMWVEDPQDPLWGVKLFVCAIITYLSCKSGSSGSSPAQTLGFLGLGGSIMGPTGSWVGPLFLPERVQVPGIVRNSRVSTPNPSTQDPLGSSVGPEYLNQMAHFVVVSTLTTTYCG